MNNPQSHDRPPAGDGKGRKTAVAKDWWLITAGPPVDDGQPIPNDGPPDMPTEQPTPATIATIHGAATPMRVEAIHLVCRISPLPSPSPMPGAASSLARGVEYRLISIGECPTMADRLDFVAAWRRLGGPAQGLGYLDNEGKFVSFEPHA